MKSTILIGFARLSKILSCIGLLILNDSISDTGIFGEEMIVDRYRAESESLFDTFITSIEHDITRGIFGNIYEVRENEEFSRLVIKTGSNILIVWLKRDRASETVFIEDIEIRT